MSAQQTVGLFQNNETAFNGYTLFSPDFNTYLIDNCGRVINEWTSEYRSGVSVYLLDDGDLLRTSRVSTSSFGTGGASGRIERFSWDGELEWTYIYSNVQYQAHHDIEPMPNGNILILAWENRLPSEAIAKGRLNGSAMWPERIIEVAPQANNTGLIMWTWSAWDHLVQDVDTTLDNYGVIAEHPELLDINYYEEAGDWMHCNSIDYNAARDEIILSSRHFSEVFIIDHSTSTAEAASHEGGNSGKGGDLLYRWGNPVNYERGNLTDQKLFGNHDARWVEEGADAGKLMIFNNSNPSTDGFFSTVEVIDPLIIDDAYIIETEEAFGPAASDWQYVASPPESFHTGKQSGAHRLPNENTLITDSSTGRIFEVDVDGNMVWDYQNPVQTNGGPVMQGNSVSNTNIFRAVRYAPSYAAFDGKDLEIGNVIEIDNNPAPCTIYKDPNSNITLPIINGTPRLVGNVITSELLIENKGGKVYELVISNLNGQTLHHSQIDSAQRSLSVSDLPKGVFIITFRDIEMQTLHALKFIKI